MLEIIKVCGTIGSRGYCRRGGGGDVFSVTSSLTSLVIVLHTEDLHRSVSVGVGHDVLDFIEMPLPTLLSGLKELANALSLLLEEARVSPPAGITVAFRSGVLLSWC